MVKGIVRRVDSYDEKLIKEVFYQNRDFILNGLRENDKVFVKPNLLSYNPPERAVTTHPIFTRAVVNFLLENNLKVLIGDMPGRSFGLSKYPEILGLTNVKNENLTIIDPAIEGFQDVKVSVKNNKIRIPKILWNVKKMYNLPKMKTHSLTFISGATKNLFGLIPRKDRLEIHKIPDKKDFSRFLLEISLSLPVEQIVIMDGIVGMEGDGPTYGNPVKLNSIVISNDALFSDYIMSKIMGFNIKEIPLFQLDYKVDGEIDGDIEKFIKPCKKPKTYIISSSATTGIVSVFYGLFKDYIQPVPDVKKDKCIKCGVCASKCSGNAIKLEPYPKFDRNKCVLCFCCNELCPEGAIHLRRRILSKFVKT